MSLTDAEKVKLIQIYQPIVYYHPDETQVPVRPDAFMEQSALWCNMPPKHDKTSWGDCNHVPESPFPRAPLLKRGQLSVNPADDQGDSEKVYIGRILADGFAPFLVSNDKRELFLETIGAGWGVSGPDNVHTDIYARLEGEIDVWNKMPLLGFTRCCSVDVRDQDTVAYIPVGENTIIPPGWQNALQGRYTTGFWLLTFFFLYPYHIEELSQCEIDHELWREFLFKEPLNDFPSGWYAGDWQAISVIVANPGGAPGSGPNPAIPSPISPLDIPDNADFPEPDYIGLSRRARGIVTNISSKDIDARDFTFMEVIHFKDNHDLRRIGTHAKVFVALGTHNNYALSGGTLSAPELDDELDVPLSVAEYIVNCDNLTAALQNKEDIEEWIEKWKKKRRVLIKILIVLAKIFGGIFVAGPIAAAAGAGVGGGFAGLQSGLAEVLADHSKEEVPLPQGPAETFDKTPSEDDLGLVLAPQLLLQQLTEELVGRAQKIEKWRVITRVDRDTQVWWPPDGNHHFGYEGKWGILSERDPFNRRSGTAIPFFEATFINSVLAKA